jgi:hypothetical protein
MLQMTPTARKLGVSVQYLAYAISEGKIAPLETYSSYEEVERHWKERVLPEGEALAAKIKVDNTNLNEVRLKHEMVKLALATLELERLKGQLVRRDVYDAEANRVFTIFKEGLVSLPARVVPELAAEFDIDPHALMLDLDDVIRGYLERLPDEIRLDPPARRGPGRPRKGTVG